MSAICPAAGDAGRISSLMASVDCRIADFVAAAYSGLFGPVGWLGPTLTAALTIYVAIYGYQLMTGRGADLPDLTRRLIAVGAVVALSTNWAAYQTLVVNVGFGAAEELAAALGGAGSGGAAPAGVLARLDAAFADITDLASTWSRATPLDAARPAASDAPPAPGSQSAINMLWFSAIALALSSAGVMAIAKIILGFLLAIGPVFIVLAIFPATRGLFEGWLGAVFANALSPVFALIGSTGALAVVEPIIARIAEDQAQGVNDAEPVFVLSIAALVFAMLMTAAVATSVRMAGAWRLSAGAREAAAAPAAAASPRLEATLIGDARILDIAAAAGQGSASASFSERRIEGPMLVVEAGAITEAPDDFARRRPARAFGAFSRRAPARGAA